MMSGFLLPHTNCGKLFCMSEFDLAIQTWRWEEKKRSRAGQASFGGPDIVKDDRRTVYIGNLPYGAEDEDVAAFLQQCGEVEDIRRGTSGELSCS